MVIFNRMKKFTFLLSLVLFVQLTNAQEEQKVAAVVNRLFSSMFNGDSIGVRSCFSDKAIMQSIGFDKSGNTVVQTGSLDAFSSYIGKQTKGAADERIKMESIKIDGDMAIVWTPYQFYYQEKFSHCGVNTFTLVRHKGEWKINYLIDTRRKENCN
ncbi:MAG: hypothetical protein RLZZ595_761 [Bacteroidota bacterium]